MLIRGAVMLDGTPADIRVRERIVEVAAGLTPRPGESVYDAAGGTVLPGLHDHHLHLRAAAAALQSVRVGPDEVAGRQALAHVLAGSGVDDDGWIRAVGYHEAVAGALDRGVLDEICPAVPLRVQHRTGVLWILNSAGLQRLGLVDHPDGRLRSADAAWAEPLRSEPPLDRLSRQLSAYGITGVTDATPDLDAHDVAALQEAHRSGRLRQRVGVLAPGKRILHDDALDLDETVGWMRDTHAAGVPVAVHCVTAAQLVVTLEALRCAGRHPLDRIEHAAVVPDHSIGDLAASGVTVVTQPNFVAERGDQYLADVPVAEHHELWRVSSLRRAGVPVALSTDAPFGRADPWAAMRAAVRRRTASGVVLGEAETVSATAALTMFLGEPSRPAVARRIAPDAPADLCILATPPAETLAELDAEMVAATVVAGEVVFEKR
ncbi:putative TIM-barrel fold metal-dependent hydrolase [Mycolicibacterium chubuense NBB4]|uniref:Putative TIM-barrel fold metal-dependent hydrolase n=1 Tax=Mycolicibacterium chubuense (strain NBB4) TaxID=710421 RepID=I4BCL9_MYCCN|nr:amidohydrolase family protein [Mycolicibacterium chubuense]AFM15026.1 putative TIM-barrel fold metal-dependent hydrolase [Mycolicibacterium chubuense NBB4]